MKNFVAQCYYIFVVAAFTSAGLLFLFWDNGNTAEGRALLVAFAVCGFVASVGTSAIVTSMMAKNWPKESDWLDNSFGLGAILYALWLLAKILVPTYLLQ